MLRRVVLGGVTDGERDEFVVVAEELESGCVAHEPSRPCLDIMLRPNKPTPVFPAPLNHPSHVTQCFPCCRLDRHNSSFVGTINIQWNLQSKCASASGTNA